MAPGDRDENQIDKQSSGLRAITASELSDLRRRAVDRLRSRRADTLSLAVRDVRSLVEELELHQAELEVQNEELRRAQADLAEARDRYRSLFEFAPVGYLVLDLGGRILQGNLAAALITGLNRDEFIGVRVEKLFIPGDRDSCYLLLRRAAGSERPQSNELRLARSGGQDLWVGVEIASLISDISEPSGFRMVLTDINARKVAERALQLLNQQLEARVVERTSELERTVGDLQAASEELVRRETRIHGLTGDLLMVEQRERRRLARVLHDNLQQALVSVKFRLATLGRMGDASAHVGELQRMLDECIAISRSLTVELSLPLLHEASLEAAMEWLADWMASRFRLSVALTFEAGLPLLIEDAQLLLFVCVRELLFNVVKHASVDSATVDVRRTGDGRLQVTVSDAGQGFEPERVEAADALGLFGVRERLELFAGRMEIDAAPGRGSRFTLSIPLGTATVKPPSDSHPQEEEH